MLPTQLIQSHFQHIDPGLMDIVFELRNIIASVSPDSDEEFQRGGMTYFDASRGGHVSAGICQILIREDYIRLAFIQGVFLPDPHSLLSVEGNRIAKRFVDLYDFNGVPWEKVEDLIRASAGFDPYKSQA
jgi:hypothetical protein